MKQSFGVMKLLVWLTQLGLSAASPLVLFTLGAVWLTRRFGVGDWVIIVGIILGLFGAVGGLSSSFKAMKRAAEAEDKRSGSVNFNDHK